MHYVPAALGVALLWGAQPIIHKHLLATFHPQTMMLLGTTFYLVCLGAYTAYSWKVIKSDLPKITWRHLAWAALASVAGGFLAQVLYLYALSKHPSHLVMPLIYSSPVFTLLLGYLLLKEKISLRAAVGVVLIIAGIIVVALHKEPPPPPRDPLGVD